MHFRALSRPAMAVIVVLAAVVGGLAGRLVIPVPHTAEVRLVVGSQGLQAQQVPGYTAATVSLAETYARFLTDAAVESPKVVGVTGVRATAIADSPVVRVQADADSDKHAKAGATAAAKALVSAAMSGSTSHKQESLTSRITSATADVQKADKAVSTARSRYKDNPTAANQKDLNAALAEQSLANLTLSGLRNAYQSSVTSSVGSPLGLRIVGPAQTVTGQAKRPLELGALAGAGVAVLVLGALVMRRDRGDRDGDDEPMD